MFHNMRQPYCKILEKDDKKTARIFVLFLGNIVKRSMSIYLLQNLQGHLCVGQSFIFYLKISSDFAVLISKGTNSHILGARKNYHSNALQ